MDANQLRIGNKVAFGLVIVEIRGIHTVEILGNKQKEHFYVKDFIKASDYYAVNPYQLEGIPLTEEWLIKFGFDYDKIVYSNDRVWLAEGNGGWDVWLNGLHAGITTKITFVHQIQNLYFAIIGKELEIK